jgi:two-component system cell cycle response regulator
MSSGMSSRAGTDSGVQPTPPTQHDTQAETVQPPPAPISVAGAPEANVILIAHPAHRMLGARYRLRLGTSLEIGRSATAGISLQDVLSVSRNHASLQYTAQGVLLADLGSTNGTLIRDVPISGPTALKNGDRFQVGAVHFKFLHHEDVEQAYHSAVYELMTHDGLTGALNKARFDEEASAECARARRYRRPLALILFDIDEFKAINDHEGHLFGDRVLARIAALVRGALRSEQAFGRVGGEEFAILCPEASADRAALLAERLRELIAATAHAQGTRSLQVTCSFGVADLGKSGYGELFTAADAALYSSKHAGRNRVSLATGPPA